MEQQVSKPEHVTSSAEEEKGGKGDAGQEPETTPGLNSNDSSIKEEWIRGKLTHHKHKSSAKHRNDGLKQGTSGQSELSVSAGVLAFSTHVDSAIVTSKQDKGSNGRSPSDRHASVSPSPVGDEIATDVQEISSAEESRASTFENETSDDTSEIAGESTLQHQVSAAELPVPVFRNERSLHEVGAIAVPGLRTTPQQSFDSMEQPRTVVAEAITRDDLVVEICDQMRDEIRQELQAHTVPAEQVVFMETEPENPKRDAPKRSCWSKKWFQLLAVVALVVIVAGAVGAVLTTRNSSGDASSRNSSGDASPNETIKPTDPPTLSGTLGVMQYPCLLTQFDWGWECIIDVREDIDGFDCLESVSVPQLELTDEQEEAVKSHGTLLLPNGQHFFVEGKTLVIDGEPSFDFHSKPGGAFGEKKAIMIRVTAEEDEPENSLYDLQDETFGYRQMPTQLNLCSYGKLNIIPFKGTVDGKMIDGVYETKLPFDWPWPFEDRDENEPVDEVVSCHLAKELGSFWFLQNGIDFIMYCVPEPLNGRYAYAQNGLMPLTVYGDGSCVTTTLQLRMIGHNLGLGRSKYRTDDGETELSDVGLMGDTNSNIARKCFNGPYSWMLGWYQDRHETIGHDQKTWSGVLVGVVDFENVKADEKVILKIETDHDYMYDYYVAFNRAVGFNSGTGRGRDMVLVTESNLDNSILVAELNEGESFPIETNDDRDLVIQVDRIDLSSDPAYAHVTVKDE